MWRRFCTFWLGNRANIAINVALAIMLGALALIYDNWVRDSLWFCAGIQIGFAIMWAMAEYQQALAREKMKAEMHAIGADYVRRMREELNEQPLVPNQPRDEPRLH
jgi:hypothetical protein